jgi:UDP-N-acetylglucosamine--N-acetylmuramyl-(pentapeptide) pyrophosphoryl-undecaprenol N-acetylglucosamine transferase
MNRARNGVTVVIAAGGTGGHVYPALEIAKRLRARGVNVEWLGTHKGLEASLVPGEGFKLHALSLGGLRGKSVIRQLLAPLMLIAALGNSIKVLRSVRARLVLGMGGYAAGPGGVAAWLMRIPLFIHEQNAVPGFTNRILSRLAGKVMEAFPGSFDPRVGAVHAGNPVREEIGALPDPETRLAHRAGPIRLLVLGGSQGARAINRVLPEALAALPSTEMVEVRHQAGAMHLQETLSLYAGAGVRVAPEAFIEDMASAYAWADLVICRAGAMTVCEVAAAGVAAVLVPFPYAVDDHQTRNARFLSDAGAALLVPEADLTPAALCELLLEFASARERLLAMASSARRLSVPDAADRVTEWCLEAAHA